jgi:putative cell wall-binding protein
MGNQNNHSVARKRLSTLAITTTLAAVGVGVVGTGAANAATGAPLAHSQDGTQAPAAPTVALAVTQGTGLSSLTVTADLSGTWVDPSVAASAHAVITWNDSGQKGDAAVTSTVDFDPATGKPLTPSVPHTYDKPSTYTITVTVDDGTNPKATKTLAPITVTDATLKASLSAKSTAKNSPVVLSLAGSSVDKSVVGTASTTVDWGDKTPTTPLAFDAKTGLPSTTTLSHSYTADGTYTVKVTLDDGVGTVQPPQTFTVTVSEKTGVQVLRAAGSDRYGTGLLISQHQWADTGVTTDTRQQAKAVVLATGNDFADALVGGPLAKKSQGPLLLTDGSKTTVNADVLAEIKRVLPKNGTVYLLGGDAALNAGIEAQLKGLGYTTNRLAGQDRFQTSLKVAQVGMGDPAHLVVARGDEGKNRDGFADALAAGPYAADVWGGGNSAVVLSNSTTFDPATKAYVQSKLKAGQQNVAAIGGQAVAAMGTITGSFGTYATAPGKDRYETAAMVAQAFETKAKNAPIGIATGLQFPDALTGGAYMATIGGPLLLTDPTALSPATAAEIADVAKTTPQISIFGGEKAVSAAAANAIAAAVGVTAIGKF